LSSDDDEKSVIVLSSDDEFASHNSNLASTSRYQAIKILYINIIEAK